jgi:hypothetical protein
MPKSMQVEDRIDPEGTSAPAGRLWSLVSREQRNENALRRLRVDSRRRGAGPEFDLLRDMAGDDGGVQVLGE